MRSYLKRWLYLIKNLTLLLGCLQAIKIYIFWNIHFAPQKSLFYHLSHSIAHFRNSQFILDSSLSLSFYNQVAKFYQLYIQNVYQIFVFFFTFITNHYHFSLFLDLNDCLVSSHLCWFLVLTQQTRGSLKNSNLFMWLVGETRMLTKPSICSLTFLSLLELGRLWD